MNRGLGTGPLRSFGEMGTRFEAIDWASTPVGAPHAWPDHLRSAVGMCLGAAFPSMVWWGRPQYTLFYNDATLPMLGRARHPQWFGACGKECWTEVWDHVGPAIDGVFETGQSAVVHDMPFAIDRDLFREQAYFTLAHGPIFAPDGHVAGVLTTGAETTDRVVNHQRLAVLHALDVNARSNDSPRDACASVALVLANHRTAIPFALFYLHNGIEGVRLAAASTPLSEALAPPLVDPDEPGAVWPLAEAASSGRAVIVDLADRAPAIADLPPDPCRRAVVLPLRPWGDAHTAGFLVAGANPRQAFDADYRSFFDLVAAIAARSVVNASATAAVRHEREVRLGLEGFLATLSHELRSSLQAMGMAVTMVRRGVAAEHALDVLDRQVAHTRVLVDDLLDVSRIARGKIQLRWQTLDLRDIVQESVEQVQVALLRGHVALGVDMPAQPVNVHGDRVRLVQILVNLLDNAMKHTPATGRVDVIVEPRDAVAIVRVRDTGQGIPADVLPRIFDLFVQARHGAGGGLGIGLALSAQLVQLHGGTLEAHSDGIDQGAEFIVTLPATG